MVTRPAGKLAGLWLAGDYALSLPASQSAVVTGAKMQEYAAIPGEFRLV